MSELVCGVSMLDMDTSLVSREYDKGVYVLLETHISCKATGETPLTPWCVNVCVYTCMCMRVSLDISRCRYLFSPNNSVILPSALQTPGSWPAGAREAAKSVRLMEPAGCSTWLSGSILLLSWEFPSASPFPLKEGSPMIASVYVRSSLHGCWDCKTQRPMALLSILLAIFQLHKHWKAPKNI